MQFYKLAASTLNPAAREFVPRFAPSQPPEQAYSYAEKTSPNNGWQAAAAYDDTPDVDGEDYVMSELKEVIDCISAQPATYETYIAHITDLLNNCVDEDEDIVLHCVVNSVVDQVCLIKHIFNALQSSS